MKINIICGTNRTGSVSLKISHIIMGKYKKLDQQVIVTDLSKLPRNIFTSDVYGEKPASIRPFLEDVLRADGLVMVVPEYNGSLPGILKFFIDLWKFPESFVAKPVALIGLAAGQWGGLRAVEHLQQIFAYRNAHILPQRVFLPKVSEEIDEMGHLLKKSTEERLFKQCTAFVSFIESLQSEE